jgi:hypothetical protein
MEAARTSETLVNFYQTTRCYNPEDSNLHTHRRENLKSYYVYSINERIDDYTEKSSTNFNRMTNKRLPNYSKEGGGAERRIKL